MTRTDARAAFSLDCPLVRCQEHRVGNLWCTLHLSEGDPPGVARSSRVKHSCTKGRPVSARRASEAGKNQHDVCRSYCVSRIFEARLVYKI